MSACQENKGLDNRPGGAGNYCDIFNALPGAVIVVDRETGAMVDVNESMLSLYGFSVKDEILNGTMTDLCSGDDGHTQAEMMNNIQMIDTGVALDFEWLAKKKNGTLFWVEMSLTPCVIGGAQRVLIMVRDISERKKIEDITLGEHFFTRALRNSLPGIFYLYTYPELRLVYWNKNHELLLGYDHDEIKDKYVLDWFFPDQHDNVKQAIELVMEKGQSTLEAELLTKKGEVVPYLMTGIRFETLGKVFLVGVGVGLSERRRAEKALRENVAKQQAMIANIADVIAIVDRDGVTRYKSPNIERWFGWSPSDLVGQSSWDTLHIDDQERIKSVFELLISEPGKTSTDQCRYRCKDHSYKWIEFTAVNRLNDPDIQGVLLSYHDITDRKRIETEKEKLQDQLLQSRKIEAVGRLAGGVAHDFNNMLSIIIGRTELALMKLDPLDPLYKDLREIESVGKRSAELTHQLLAFARKQAIAPSVLDLNTTIDRTLKMLRRLIGEDITLIWKPSDDLWTVHMDQSQLVQLLANLMVNARDAIRDVGTVVIETRNRSVGSLYCETHAEVDPGDYVQLSVSDDGCGIDKVDLPNVFEPFFTTKPLGQGTGLGLATVYGIVKQNKGFVSIYSEKKRGTTLNICLPRHGVQSPKGRERTRKAPLMGGHETVLLVEDEPEILEVAQAMLENMGYTILAAGEPNEAIRLAKEHAGQIHLLMTDVVMPVMNGRELSQYLAHEYPGLKILFMSGYTSNVIAHRGVLDEGVNFIQKPFSMKDLAAKVRGALDKG